jgi:competence protein ComEA
MIDDFLFRWRFIIGSVLIVVILGGSLAIWFGKRQSAKDTANAQLVELQNQNDQLRKELSGQSGQVAGASDVQNNEQRVNINTADLAELDKLPGIGPAKAQAIVSFRESNGPFQTAEDIKNVKGIGDKSYEDLKNLITVGN